MDYSTRQAANRTFLVGLIVTSLIITPFSADPVNLPKFVALMVSSVVTFGIISSKGTFVVLRKSSFTGAISISIIFAGLIVSINSTTDLATRVYGISGRNIGFITLLCLSLTVVNAFLLANLDLVARCIKALLVVAISTALYGIVQAFGIDPVAWDSDFGNVFGFFGNPNFQSAILGLGCLISAGRLMGYEAQKKQQLYSLALFLLMLISIFLTNSVQGFFLTAVGIMIFAFHKIFRSASKWLARGFYSALLLGPIALILIVGKFEMLSSLSNIGSLTPRLTYWGVGLKTWWENPLFGTGLDSFGTFYRLNRTREDFDAVYGTVTNSAHNYFIDILSNGGLVLLLPVLFLIIFTVRAIFRLVEESGNAHNGVLVLVAVWVGLFTQAMISPNQIALMLWFFAMSGFLIGLSSLGNSQPENAHVRSTSNKGHKQSVELAPQQVLAVFASLVLSLVIAFPPFVSSIRYLGALKSGYVQQIYDSSLFFPSDAARNVAIINTLSGNGFYKEALELGLRTVSEFPSSFEAWNELSKIPSISEKLKTRAVERMKALDPNNPNVQE
jgi:O-antigen ligase